MRDRESGFTLLELMVAVVVVSILAAIAIPSFFSETRKARAAAEVAPMFNDLRVRLEQYLQENGVYPDTLGEIAMHPTATPTSATLPLLPLPPSWQALRVRISGPDQVRCGYTWVTSRSANGTVGPTASNAGPMATAFSFVPPIGDWYYLLAKCKMDANHALFSWYFTSSSDATLQKQNDGE
jgi:type IV pilus assembly protein PilE